MAQAQPNNTQRTAVVVLNYNGGAMLLRCLDSILADGCPPADLIVVDNASSDGSLADARNMHPNLHFVVNAENLLFSGGCNKGIVRAQELGADYILLLNNDARLTTGCLAGLKAFMQRRQDAGACQPLLVFEHNQSIIQSAGCRVAASGRAWDHLCGQSLDAAGTRPLEVPGVTGGAMFLRTKALTEVGLLPEGFGMYFEDVDLSLRLRAAGWRLFCLPHLRVPHVRSATTDRDGAARRIFYCERNSHWLARRNFPRWKTLGTLIAALPLAVIAMLSNLAQGQIKCARSIALGTLQGLGPCPDPPPPMDGPRRAALWRITDKRIYPPSCPAPKKEDQSPAREPTGSASDASEHSQAQLSSSRYNST